MARRMWRRLLLRSGDVRGFLGALRGGFPDSLLDDERGERSWAVFLAPLVGRGRVALSSQAVLSGLLEAKDQVRERAQQLRYI